ncbi:MAG: cytochrome c peroxidase [Nannocystaceae bacterium]
MSRSISVLAIIPFCFLVACDDAPESVEDRGGYGSQDEDLNWKEKKEKKALAKEVRATANTLGLKPMPEAPKVKKKLADLGQALAFDKVLSGNKNISCLTCHHPALGTDDDRHLSVGDGAVGLGLDRVHPEDIFIPRNAPPLFNLHVVDDMFWDGRVNVHNGVYDTPANAKLSADMIAVFEQGFGAAAAQAMFPVTSRREMRGKVGVNDLATIRDDLFRDQWSLLMQRLGEIPEYVKMFEKAYPGTKFKDMTFAHAANAIAAFEIDAYAATNTPWDRFLRGDDNAMTLKQLKGAKLFMGEGRCATCHNGAALSDFQFHNTALPQFGPGKGDGTFKDDDVGRAGETTSADNYRFRTPPLRNVELTGPYGHAGQFSEISDFVRHYMDPETSLLNYDISQIDVPLQPTVLNNSAEVLANFDAAEVTANISEADVPLIVEFLGALTDPDSLDLTHTIPKKVPSGLPVGETVITDTTPFAGTIHLPMGFETSGAREFQIQEQSMCDGEAYADFSFNRATNSINIQAHFDGLPYRPHFQYEYDPSTPFNQYPAEVQDGKWQMWFVGHYFTARSIFYYDFGDGHLIGNENDITGPLPPTAFPVELPVLQMLCTDFFESDPNTLVADVSFEYQYDHITDMLGSAGVYVAVLPYNIFNPTELDIYYTQGGLPAELAMNFDEIADDIHDGKGGLMLVTSYEPFPKPSYLDARDNLMIGWGSPWPRPAPIFTPYEECGTSFQWNTGFVIPP